MAVVQVIMAIRLFYYAVGLPGQIYVTTVLIGLGYGAHWAILPAAASELFGLKSFGACIIFLQWQILLVLLSASGIYDHYAKEQAAFRHHDSASMLIKPLRDDDSLSCVGSEGLYETLWIARLSCESKGQVDISCQQNESERFFIPMIYGWSLSEGKRV
ncbi:unnamed protein product [Prunus armeniaca]